jgi:FtsH-binding integral membrane protein
MRQFWMTYLVSNLILAALALAITAKGTDAPLLPFLIGGVFIPLPAVVIGIWQPNPKWKFLLGFLAALIGILLIVFLIPAMSGRWK